MLCDIKVKHDMFYVNFFVIYLHETFSLCDCFCVIFCVIFVILHDSAVLYSRFYIFFHLNFIYIRNSHISNHDIRRIFQYWHIFHNIEHNIVMPSFSADAGA